MDARHLTPPLATRMNRLAFEAVRRPGLFFLHALRSIGPVRRRLIPAFLKEELDAIPSGAVVREISEDLERLRRGRGPLVIGPWVGEVGFELLYWIPFLNWAVRTHKLDRRRLIAVSRGGARPWYRHLTDEYVDVFNVFTLQEYNTANQERWHQAGHQKQYQIEKMDTDLVDRALARLGVAEAEILHPSLMYRLLRFFWFEKAGIGLLHRHTDYRRLAPVERSQRLESLPSEYVAVRFYFRPSFPDTPDNRRFAAGVIRSLSRQVPVVLLNTGLRPDEHEDLEVPGHGVHHVDHLMRLEDNLELQTEIISHARAYVGTYGGLAYVGPFYGVPSVAFFSSESELIPAHLDVSWRLGRSMGVTVAAIHTGEADLLRQITGGPIRPSE